MSFIDNNSSMFDVRHKGPCDNCKKRKGGCHSSCLKYVAFSLALEDDYKRRQIKGEDIYLKKRDVDQGIRRAKSSNTHTGYFKKKRL